MHVLTAIGLERCAFAANLHSGVTLLLEVHRGAGYSSQLLVVEFRAAKYTISASLEKRKARVGKKKNYRTKRLYEEAHSTEEALSRGSGLGPPSACQ